MASTPAPHHRTASSRQGIAYWMRRVIVERRKVARTFDADAVHDLRVALRRCRSMADAMMSLDPDPAWRQMKKAGRRLFRRLGELRDTQVMTEWVKKLAPEDDPVAGKMLELLDEREAALKHKAERALARFDTGQWKDWIRHLEKRCERVPLDGLVFQHLALERWTEARNLHRRALRNRSRTAWHQLRIGVKRFRYIIENFLPQRHAVWGRGLKQIQDLLGEVHDLDVLWFALRETGDLFSESEHLRWRDWIEAERGRRLSEYRSKMCGRQSLWALWRNGLPQGDDLALAALTRIECFADFTDPVFPHSRHVSQLALELFDELRKQHVPGPYAEPRARDWLRAASLLHNVGRAEGSRGHHKASFHLIRSMEPPLGWTRSEWDLVALIARYHRGVEPTPRHPDFQKLAPQLRNVVLHLSGLLRLAAALDANHDARVRRLRVELQPNLLLIWAYGFREEEEHSRILASERHLLERALGLPVLIRPHPGRLRRAESAQARAACVAD